MSDSDSPKASPQDYRAAYAMAATFIVAGLLIAYIEWWGADGTAPPGIWAILLGWLVLLHTALFDAFEAVRRRYRDWISPTVVAEDV